jgi:hypothetical protein
VNVMDCEPRRLVEPVPVQDIFVSGLGAVEDLGGGVYRFVFFSRQYVEGEEERVTVAKLVGQMDAIPPAIFMAAQAIGFSLTGQFVPRKGAH